MRKNPQILDVHFQIWLTFETAESLVEFHSVTSEGSVRKKKRKNMIKT